MSEPLPVHVTVVIPTRNEEAAIVDTIRSVPNDGWCEKLDFLIVDGNSTDRTRELAEEEGAMPGLHGFGNWVLSTTAKVLYWYGVHDSQSGMWVFRKSIFEDERVRPRHDGMPLSQEFKIRARRYLGKKKTAEVSVPYRPRVGEAEINTWGDGLLNLRFLFTHRLGLTRQITPWGPE